MTNGWLIIASKMTMETWFASRVCVLFSHAGLADTTHGTRLQHHSARHTERALLSRNTLHHARRHGHHLWWPQRRQSVRRPHPLPGQRLTQPHCCTTLDDTVIICGGRNDVNLSDAHIHYPDNDSHSHIVAPRFLTARSSSVVPPQQATGHPKPTPLPSGTTRDSYSHLDMVC
jgi:hypothetical protein